jgi:hypothetical protein
MTAPKNQVNEALATTLTESSIGHQTEPTPGSGLAAGGVIGALCYTRVIGGLDPMGDRVHDEDSIEVHLYGKLAQRLSGGAARHKRVLYVKVQPDETLDTLLARLGIDHQELYTVFLNSSLLATHNGMAPWLRYPQAREEVWIWDGEVALGPGDRLGLFGEDMALLVV